MEPHILELPRRVVIGNGVLRGMDRDFSSLGIQESPLVICDGVTYRIAGIIVLETLSGLDPSVGTVSGSTTREADRIRAVASRSSCIVAVGGGSVIDVGKVAAFGAGIPLVSVPTAPSHDGIASERASLAGARGKESIKARPPLAVVADVEVLMRAPKRLIASGSADALSNLTSVEDWKLARDRGEYFSAYSASLARFSADIVMAYAVQIGAREEKGIRKLMEALLTSSISMSLAGSSRPASGGEHAFSHALDELGSGALHGEQCGVGSMLTAYLQGGDWSRIRDVLGKLGAPTTAKLLGVGEDMVVKALVRARGLRDRHTILDEVRLDESKAREAALATGVIG